MTRPNQAYVLTIAGSDSSGGAGIQADIKTIHALGGHAATALTALTAQSAKAVYDIFEVPPAFIVRQIEIALADMTIHAIKTGMLASRRVIEAVSPLLDDYTGALIVDPVMVATSGGQLLENDACSALQSLIIRQANLVTPNMPEAALLTNRSVETVDDMKFAADILMRDGAKSVLIKGGHGKDPLIIDLLATENGFETFEHPRLAKENIELHGTGCMLASAIAISLAQGLDLSAASKRAIAYVQTVLGGNDKVTDIKAG
ncbi:MAG: bifunctional hydroxymethylpyrimidine kinase/phosphomethylpyrimidine kinase [Alphaproteobacteria bacterium]|nr:bifunctional hydroxymethylpyrimidine kinase/phosphomethylpyrimidine kinase [Alphaproteobacteria bacterium]